MIDPTEKINRAIVNLDGNQNWEEIKKWILDSFAKEAIEGIADLKSQDYQHRIRQGQVQQLFVLKNHILLARERLEKKKDDKRPMEVF